MDIATRQEGHIDLVLTDIVMPGMNGRGLVERLAGIRPRIKSLYMSGYTDDDIVRRGFNNATIAELGHAIDEIRVDDAIGGVILTGEQEIHRAQPEDCADVR